jgi:hypothetical protein
VAQYQTITVSVGWGSLDSAIDRETKQQGRDGWRVLDITAVSDQKAHVQFVKD